MKREQMKNITFEIAKKDFPNQMSWYDAKKACADLGNGWRLPTKDEVILIYENKDKIGGIAMIFYWSSTDFNNLSAWIQNFHDGFQFYDFKNNDYSVRAVRDIK